MAIYMEWFPPLQPTRSKGDQTMFFKKQQPPKDARQLYRAAEYNYICAKEMKEEAERQDRQGMVCQAVELMEFWEKEMERLEWDALNITSDRLIKIRDEWKASKS